jgi:hypothetical protein
MQSQADFLLLRAHSFVLLAASSSAEGGGMFSEKNQRVAGEDLLPSKILEL